MSAVRAARMADGTTRIGVADIYLQAEHPHRVEALARQYAWFDGKGRLRLASDADMARRALTLRAANDHLYQRGEDLLIVRHCNAYVNSGLNNGLDREFGLGGTAVGYVFVASNSTAVTASTAYANGASGGTAANTIIKAISPAATRSAQTVTAGATFANADFTSGVFVVNKLGMLITATDAGTGLVDVIGGTSGSAPYNKTFGLDLTGSGTFSFTPQLAVTNAAA